ncbi:MAG TPA: hypothetical protein VFX37_00645 [Pseudolabrys sp.]|nr:hypothetical protein [Pseudolabrys sp.]
MTQTSHAFGSEYFIGKAEQCFRLARHARMELADSAVAQELDAIGNEFLAKAVEIDTERDRIVNRQQQ